MTAKKIYDKLCAEGMSHIGAIAMIGNMAAESGLRADNLQDSYAAAWGISDAEYCRRVNAGEHSVGDKTFWTDGAGFGLYQLTAPSRKLGYYNVARLQWGTLIEDADCQIWYCCYELQSDYPSLWRYLCSADCDLETAVARICREFERPAVDNSAVRHRLALRCKADIEGELSESDEPSSLGASNPYADIEAELDAISAAVAAVRAIIKEVVT